MVFRLLKGSSKADPFAPPRDPVFSYLYERVVHGFIPLYRAEVPLGLIRPYADMFRPHTAPEGLKVINGMIRTYKEGHRLPLWLYPQQSTFIMSDDYLVLFMAKELGLQTYECEIMGWPSISGVNNIQGPAPVEYVRSLPGGPNYDPKKSPPLVVKEMPED